MNNYRVILIASQKINCYVRILNLQFGGNCLRQKSGKGGRRRWGEGVGGDREQRRMLGHRAHKGGRGVIF